RQPQVGPCAFEIGRDRIGAAHNHTLSEAFRRIGEAQPRLEILSERLIKTTAVPILPGEQQLSGVEIEVRLTIGDFDPRRMVFPAHPEIECQVIRDAPVILNICAEYGRTVAPGSRAHTAAEIGGEAEYEI